MMTSRLIGAAMLLLASQALAAEKDYNQAPSPADWATMPDSEFYIATVHIDGKTNIKGDAGHPPEAFPSAVMPDGGGLILTPPNADGTWNMRAFVFAPAEVTARQGDMVTLHFVGVQGPSHQIAIEGQDEVIELKRGEQQDISFEAKEPGIIRFVSLGRQPSMQGRIVVLPKP